MATRRPVHVHELAARTASRPEHVAAVHGGESITYRRLDRRANGLAAHLVDRGVRPGDVVAVHGDRTITTVVALLAVWRAGAAYLPLEPDTDADRARSALDRTGCRTVVGDPGGPHCLAVVDAHAGGETDAAPDLPDGAGTTAYVVPGPAGAIAVGHDALDDLCRILAERYGTGPDDRVLQLGPSSVGDTVEQTVVSLAAGATLVLPESSWTPGVLAERVRSERVTVLDLDPVHWRAFLAGAVEGPPELRLTIVGGDVVDSDDCRRAMELMPGTRLLNSYAGPATTCVAELSPDLLPAAGPVPVGGPLPGAAVYVLDDEGRRVGPGERGEIHVGGPVTYLGGDGIVPDPFAGAPDALMVRTGDLGVWTARGDLKVVGHLAAPARAAERPAPAVVDDGGDVLDRGVALLWRQVLEIDDVSPEDSFFDLGGNSILAAELVARARGTFGLLITHVRPLLRRLVADGTLTGFIEAVRAARAGTLDGDAEPISFDAEGELGVDIDPSRGGADWCNPRTIVLTGATGFLGVYLLRELLATSDADVHCLVRADDAATGLARIRENAEHYFGDDLAEHCANGRVVAVPGDLAEPRLGLSEERFDELARTVDVIHHPGGLVNFVYPYSTLRPANVDGTREIVRMAARHRNAPVHYTSTIAVLAGFGTAGVRHVDETTPLAHADHLTVGYVESKWVAERLLTQAAGAGLPVAIYRAADISGDREVGAWNTATEMCAMQKFVTDTGMAPVAELALDYTPVDVFAAAVAHIAASSSPTGDVYHLTNADKANISVLTDRLRAHGHEIDEVPWQTWVDELVRVAVEDPEHPMTPFAPLFIDRCSAARMTVAEMYLEDTFPAFSRSNVERALDGSGIEIPPVDAAMLDRYVDYLTAIDYIGAT